MKRKELGVDASKPLRGTPLRIISVTHHTVERKIWNIGSMVCGKLVSRNNKSVLLAAPYADERKM
jgi:hypothetical protein